nr:hypothetical protein [Yersinia bercovieri]
MDTVEQVSGYYFKEMHNLSQGELAFWVTVDEVEKQFNGIDIVAFAFILGGLNIIPVPGKPHTVPTARNQTRSQIPRPVVIPQNVSPHRPRASTLGVRPAWR